MVKPMDEFEREGIFARVLSDGDVKIGDSITVIP